MAVAKKKSSKTATSTPTQDVGAEHLSTFLKKFKTKNAVEWRLENRPVAYDRAVAFMEAKAGMIREKAEGDLVWLLEHPPVYTAGTSAKESDLKNPIFPVHHTGRGGQYTYHGPGQRIAYVMMDLQKRAPDLKTYIYGLEEWLITALSTLGVRGYRVAGRVGIWVDLSEYTEHTGKLVPKGTEAKIAAIGVRVRKWVAYHGVALNVSPDLSHYKGIVPCGISDLGVTSLKELGLPTAMEDVDNALLSAWDTVFKG